jgi:AraC-like DNA-binding protein
MPNAFVIASNGSIYLRSGFIRPVSTLASSFVATLKKACAMHHNVVVLLQHGNAANPVSAGIFQEFNKNQGASAVTEGADFDWFSSRLAEWFSDSQVSNGAARSVRQSPPTDTPISVAPLLGSLVAARARPAAHTKTAVRRRTLGILGMGGLGEKIAEHAHRQLGASILYTSTARSPMLESDLSAAQVSIDRLLVESDVICMVMPAEFGVSALIGPREVEAITPQKLFVARRHCAGIERVLAYMSLNYAEKLHIQELAGMAGFSESHFQHRFAALLGITPHRYQLMLRVFHAMEFLRRGMAIRDVAQSVGFADQSHLHRYFRRVVGVSPGLYQRRFNTRKPRG